MPQGARARGPQQYVFGPVLSRRLGRSLGIDVVPFKACTYDCVYCQLGRTTIHTTERKEYVPLDDVLAQAEDKVRRGPRPDYVTLAGSGEPTLYSRLGELVAGLQVRTGCPVAVLTNGSLVDHPEVRGGLAQADLLMPSLDAALPAEFAAVNRPVAGIAVEAIITGLAALRAESNAHFWLEILLVRGINDSDEHLDALAAAVVKIRPERLQLTTVVRPAKTSKVLPVEKANLDAAAGRFRSVLDPLGIPIDIVGAEEPHAAAASNKQATLEDVRDLLRRHPCSIDDVAWGLEIPVKQAATHVEALLEADELETSRAQGLVVYSAVAEK